jgi:hypothetical protein
MASKLDEDSDESSCAAFTPRASNTEGISSPMGLPVIGTVRSVGAEVTKGTGIKVGPPLGSDVSMRVGYELAEELGIAEKLGAAEGVILGVALGATVGAVVSNEATCKATIFPKMSP